jgi:RNA 3'-terminal phosphate cyclase (ATP)
MIELDGSMGEGGGQILRTSLALALVTKKSFRLKNIRAGRAKPGLQPQHLTSGRAAASVGQAQVHGDALGSRNLVFEPGQIVPGAYNFNIGTAGATSLVLHTLYLPLAWRADVPSALTLRGGTHVLASPSFDFLEYTWRRYLEHVGFQIRVRQFQPGFYPRGGGVVEVAIEPCSQIRGLQLQEATAVARATVISAVANLPDHIAERQARRAASGLKQMGMEIEIRQERWTNGPGTVISAVLDTLPVPTLFFALGRRGRPAEQVADDLLDQIGNFLRNQPGVDLCSADQVVLPLALAAQASTFRVTEVTSHLLTNIAVIQKFVDREVLCQGKEGEPGAVRIF